MGYRFRVHAAMLAALALVTSSPARAEPPKAETAQLDFFEKEIRPLLVANCYKCHGPDKHKGGLRLDSQEAILSGGDSGPALVPGQPEKACSSRPSGRAMSSRCRPRTS